MTKILLDMNYPAFQEQLSSIEKQEQRALLTTLKKIKQLEWEELYKDKDKGIRWELITSKTRQKVIIYIHLDFHKNIVAQHIEMVIILYCSHYFLIMMVLIPS